jgi:hypothetical protein
MQGVARSSYGCDDMEAMRLLAFGLLAALAASVAHARGGAGARPPADVIPFGADWSCFHALDAKATGETPRCERSETECKQTRATLVDPAKMTACAPQATATVVTYFDPKRATWRFLASPDDDGCLALRGGLVASKAYQRVAQCEVVGKRFPPPAKLETSVITPGKGWWCLELPTPAPKGVRPACTRSIAQCEDLIRRGAMAATKCKARDTAHLVTFRDTGSVWGYAASSTAEACAGYRERVLEAASEVSACAAISEVARPKLDRKRVPRGSGWVCFMGAGAQRPIGSCARSAKDCSAAYELDRYVLGASAGCIKQSTAFARNVQEQFFVFPTAALCEANIGEHTDGSRCESVN